MEENNKNQQTPSVPSSPVSAPLTPMAPQAPASAPAPIQAAPAPVVSAVPTPAVPVQPAPAQPTPAPQVPSRLPAYLPGDIPPQSARPAPLPPLARPGTMPFARPQMAPGQQRPKANAPQLGMGCLVFAVIFFLLAIVAVVLIMISGGGDNALTQNLGITGQSLKDALITITSIVMGLIALVLMIVTIVLAFKRTVIPAADVPGRKKAMRNIIIMATLFAVSLMVWVVVYVLLAQLQVKEVYEDWVKTTPADVTRLTGPIDIEFDTTNIDAYAKGKGYELAQCDWDFNADGRTDETGCNLSRTFDEIGKFNITLTTTYSKNGEELADKSDTFPKLITIDNLYPEASVKISPERGAPPLTVSFDAGDSKDPNGRITKYEWLFSEKESWQKGEATASYIYEEVGKHEASLRLTDNQGAEKITNYVITVEEFSTDKIFAMIKTTPTEPNGIVPFQIRFDGGGSSSPFGAVKSYRWDFGDGTPAQRSRSVSKVYRDGGDYTVTLEVEDEKGNKATDSILVSVKNPSIVPIAKITTDKETLRTGTKYYIEGTIPYTVKFSAKDTTDKDNNVTYYGWDFNGDNQVDSEGDEVEYTFTEEGVFNANLTVIDADNQKSTDSLEVIVKENSLRPAVSTDPTPASGPVPFVVSFDASGSEYDDGYIIGYQWDWGDGNAPKMGDAHQTHKYTVVGEYIVTLTVYTDDQKNGEITKRVMVLNVPLEAKITPSVTHGKAPLKVMFDPSSSLGNIKKYDWEFGDGKTSQQTQPTYTYTKPGVYNVKLTVTDDTSNVKSAEYQIIVEGK